MTRPPVLFGLAFLLLCTIAEAATFGLSVPSSGDYAAFGEQFRAGAQRAFLDSGTNHTLVAQDDKCTSEGAASTARSFAEQQAKVVFGFLCNASAMSAADVLRSSGIPILVAGARSSRLIKDREREEWNLWRLSPGDDYPVAVAAKAILERWQQTPFAIVDDGTIYGRRFSDSLQQQLLDEGLEPQIIDTYRTGLSTQAALVRRLKRSGVSAVFLAAIDASDLVTIINDASRLNLPFEFVTTEALRVLPYLEETPDLTMPLDIIDWPDAGLDDFAQFEQEGSVSRHFLMGYAAAQLVLQLGDDALQSRNALATRSFDTILRPISFKADGSATFNPYRIMNWDGSRFVPHETNGDR